MVALVVIAVSEVLGQGCAQCKHVAEKSSIDNDTIGMAENPYVKRKLLFYHVGIPIILVITVLVILFRKKIASGFRKLVGKTSKD